MATRSSSTCPLHVAFTLAFLAWAIGRANAGPVESTDKSSNLHCSPTQWYNILFFFVTNYAIHAATVISLPGESGYTSAAYKACCLLVPFAGIRRGLNVFLRASALAENALHAAARANALCMIVRSKDWRPRSGGVIEGCKVDITMPEAETEIELEGRENGSFGKEPVVTTSESLDDKNIEVRPDTGKRDALDGRSIGGVTITKSVSGKSIEVSWDVKAPYEHHAPSTWYGRTGAFLVHSYRFRAMPLEHQVVPREDIEVHGVCRLPPGYILCFVPPHMDMRPRGDILTSDEVKLASQFNALQILWSMAQTMIGSWTLWQARGSQLNRYGYAAFGLTVIPYVIASIINLLGSLVSRQYNDVYLVHSGIMDEAIERGGIVDGVVGTVCPPESVHNTCGYGDEEKAVGDDERGILGEAVFEFHDDHDHDGAMRCWRVDSPHTASNMVLTLPPPRPSRPAGQGYKKWSLRGCWLRWTEALKYIYRQPSSTPRKPSKRKHKPSKTQYVISVPCHGPFRRLPPAPFELPFLIISIALLVLSIAAPYLIIYFLTGFKLRQAEESQGNMTLHWLCLGQVYGLIVTEFERHTGRGSWGTILLVVLAAYGWATVGGIVIVIQEMIEFGTCEAW